MLSSLCHTSEDTYRHTVSRDQEDSPLVKFSIGGGHLQGASRRAPRGAIEQVGRRAARCYDANRVSAKFGRAICYGRWAL